MPETDVVGSMTLVLNDLDHTEYMTTRVFGPMRKLAEAVISLSDKSDNTDAKITQIDAKLDRLEVKVDEGFAQVDRHFGVIKDEIGVIKDEIRATRAHVERVVGYIEQRELGDK